MTTTTYKQLEELLFKNMKFSVFSLTSYFVASALAADCWGSVNGIQTEHYRAYWDARNQMCHNEKCAQGQDCNVQTSVTSGGKQLVVILQRRKNGVKGFKDCYVSGPIMTW